LKNKILKITILFSLSFLLIGCNKQKDVVNWNLDEDFLDINTEIQLQITNTKIEQNLENNFEVIEITDNPIENTEIINNSETTEIVNIEKITNNQTNYTSQKMNFNDTLSFIRNNYHTEEIINLNEAMENFIEYHTTYFNSLKEYIKTLNLKSELNAVKYGMEIPNSTLQLLFID
jgi:hypothetical protein